MKVQAGGSLEKITNIVCGKMEEFVYTHSPTNNTRWSYCGSLKMCLVKDD